MRNIRLLLEYNGSQYVGFQEQETGPTIQGCLYKAFECLHMARPPMRVAGRTDAGVHAKGQVVSFLTESTLPARRFAPSLNAFLPKDITVHTSTEMPREFDAKRNSKSKRYLYQIYVGPQPAAFEQYGSWELRKTLDTAAMQQAAKPLLGEHDFNAFRSSQCEAPHAIRKIYTIEINEHPRPPLGKHIHIWFHANAFCRYMCRILAGTLVEVGRGQRSVESVGQALERRDRCQAGITAPANGLTLMEVHY